MLSLFIANLLGWSLQVSLVVMAAALVARLMPIDSASVRHAWWRAVLVVCLALPVVQPWHRPAIASPALAPSITDVAIDRVGTTPTSEDGSRTVRPVVQLASWTAIVVVVLSAGMVFRIVWLATGLVRLRRLRETGERVVPAETDVELQELMEAGADVRYVDGVGQPVTFGAHRPVVLLPSRLRALDPSIQRVVIAHELWHVKRRDWAWMLAEEIVRAVLWFNPAIWWLISQVQATREEVVDELTVLLTNARRSYLEALLLFADQPSLLPSAPFARRRHLYQRMLLLSKEAVMSSRRIVASCAGMLIVLAAAGGYGAAAFPLTSAPLAEGPRRQTPPRDSRPTATKPATSRESELQAAVRSTPSNPAPYLELAKLQEQRGAVSDAEATLEALRKARPNSGDGTYALAALYARAGQFDRALRVIEDYAALDPTDPARQQIVAVYYWEKVSKDPDLTPVEKRTYIHEGIAATDRALQAQPEYLDSMIYKNILLRTEANLETDAAKQKALLTEADALRTRALALRKTQGNGVPPPPPPPSARTGAETMPPPPPPPPPPGMPSPVRVGIGIKAPTKVADVQAVYPPEAIQAHIQGAVVAELLVDQTGTVKWARVLRSIPMLDQAALDAVKQWRYTPTLLNGAPVPVLMTVTVNFALPGEKH
jgi:TonB family protein